MNLPKAIGIIIINEDEMTLYEKIRAACEVMEMDEFGHYTALRDIFMLYPGLEGYFQFAEKGDRITDIYPLLLRSVDSGWAYKSDWRKI